MTGVLLTAQAALFYGALLVILAGVTTLWVPAASRWADRLLWVGFGLLSACAVLRWVLVGHPPIFGTFENSIAASWFVLLVVLLGRRSRYLATLPDDFEPWFALWLPAILGYGLFFEQKPLPLTISERSLVVDLHVLFAWGAHTALLLGATCAVLALAKARTWRTDEVDEVLYRATTIGFVMFTAMIVVGAVYSYLLFADFYRWEMVEAFAAASWLGLSAVLHARMFFEWRGTKLAWAVLAVMPLVIGTFWVWSVYAGTYHHFEVPEIRAE